MPIEEGGLDIHDFEDMQKALMKFVWRLFTGKSLWADFFRVKYIQNNHLSLLTPKKGTWFWKSIVRCISDVLTNSKWLVCEGNISFWFDNWDEEGPLNTQYPFIEKDGQDVLIWLKDSDGKFLTSSAWDCIQVRASLLPWAQWIWQNSLPKKISIMMWKAYNNCLSVDEKIRSIGIPLVSKCDCCLVRHIEGLNHVLCTGDFTRHIWCMVTTQVGVQMGVFRTWNEQINFWFHRAGKSSQLCIIFGILSSLISWQLWNRQCKARYDNKVESVASVWQAIKYWIRKLMNLNMKVSYVSNKDVAILNILDIPAVYPKPKIVRAVRWSKHLQGWVKLNIDGSGLGNPGPTGAWGIICDSSGRIRAAFSVFIG
ncbi:hypothetical protein I3760_16G029200 [Carya illinoinensis]|nr:hypothetical protein I3760_16G029200 [Carya illinoinensis]